MKNVLLLAMAASLVASSAAAEGKLNIYNWSDYIAEDTIKKFEAATGIEVTYDVYDSNEVLEAKLLTGSSGYDVVVPTGDFLQRQIAAGVYQKLNKDLLPNLTNMDPALMKAAEAFDAENEHAVIYQWGTTGIGYNATAVAERLGKDYEVNSWDVVFNPEIAAKLADCGIALLDSPSDMMPTAANYLGFDPNTTDASELEKAAELLKSVRKHVRYFHSSQYINDLANGDICVAVGYSGDVFQAATRAEEAKNGVDVGYVIPNEGATQWFDLLAIPVDAPNAENAHKFINFVMDAQITADITNYVWYAAANKAALPLIDPEILTNSGIYPTAEASKNLWSPKVKNARTDRLITRLWTSVKTGQ
jgi:putrescine transport system substrate-binding protein